MDNKKFKIKKKSPVKFVVFTFLILLFCLILFYVFQKDKSDEDEFLAPVITIKPIYGSLEKTLKISSQVETGRLITLVPRVGGTLMELNVKAGDEVTEGQIVAQVDSAPYQLTFLQAQSAFLTARSTYERIRQVFYAQGVSRQHYDEARMAFEVASAQFELAQLNVEYTRIRAPMNATVLMCHSTEGGIVGAGTPLLTLGDLNDLRVKAAIPEIHYRFFADNWETMPVRIQVPAFGDEIFFELRPLSLSPYVSPENRSFLVEYEIPRLNSTDDDTGYFSDAGILRPGMFVNVIFTLDNKDDVHYLPFKVMASGNQLWYITEDTSNISGQNMISLNMQFIPDYFNNDYFQIPSEFADKIFILEGQHFIRPGQRLNIISGVPQ